MPLKILFTVGLLFAAFSPAQEIGKLDLVGVSNRIVPDLTAERYMICGTEVAKQSKRSVAVSLESISATEIDPTQDMSVVLKIKNDGGLSVVLLVSPDNAVLQPERDAIEYRVELPINAGASGQTLVSMGWFELYGSSSQSRTTVNLSPGEWITVRGHFKPHRWLPGEVAKVYSDFQLYELSPQSTSGVHTDDCVRQGSGAMIVVHFKP